jgi:hypothetical protein
MRARCVDNKGVEESFTVGKVYEIGLGRFVVCNEVDISGACGQYESSDRKSVV